MLQIEGQLCYSPEPPGNYVRWLGGVPKGPLVGVVDRATGCELARAQGYFSKEMVSGMPPWNLAYLLLPQVDILPGAYRRFSEAEGVKMIADFEQLAPQLLGEILRFAESAYEWLLLPPLQFMRKIRGQSLPGGIDYAATWCRAETIDDITPALGSNVIQARFGCRR